MKHIKDNPYLTSHTQEVFKTKGAQIFQNLEAISKLQVTEV
jgi:hypothetical protein